MTGDIETNSAKALTHAAPAKDRAYGAYGTLAVLTPQANTTVEPELWSLLPPGWSLLNARLTSNLDTIEARLMDYADNYVNAADQFANAPLDSIAIACTGASYLIGKKKEQRIIEELEKHHGVPCTTAALASVKALNEMEVKKLALLTPYPESLNQVSSHYWESHGFTIVAKAGPSLLNDAFHPIYAMSAEAVHQSYTRLSESDADAILMLGTGMPTLSSLLHGHQQQLKPAISCNLALTWAAINATESKDIIGLENWLAGDHWQQRFRTIAGDC